MKYIRETPQGRIVGKIVETEAYISNDPASHAFRGKTKRNSPMFGEAGTAYIYHIYGMYNCLNIVTQKENIGEAVLIRALEPLKGIKTMQKNRKTKEIKHLANGPGKICMALSINRDLNSINLIDPKSPLKIEIPNEYHIKKEIIATKRIGITNAKEVDLRFYIKDNLFISKK
ncbi:MAG: DNA-3-methyladenine glycosylase [Deltaproteobacteria bacterium]|nr:DNA-3-methyladenine glycosylase [Deltaproteobacteria bacterium]